MKTQKPTPKINPKEILKILTLKNEVIASLLDDELLNLMMENSTIQVFYPRDIIVKQNDPSDSLFLFLKGRCSVVINDAVLSFMEAGDMAGEMGVIQNRPRSATIIALEESHALRIPGDIFLKMLQDPRLSSWTINVLTERLKRCSSDAARVLNEMELMMQDQMELARVQRSLLPLHLPEHPRVALNVLYKTCAYAGGDYYDAILIDDHHLLLIVADVTGHGAQASISMAIVRSFIHQTNIGKTPATILKRLNRYLFEYGPSQHFVTSQVAMLDLETLKLQVAYAGHPPILHLRGEECRTLVAPRSFFLRYRWEAVYQSATMQLQSGDRIALYTDGVIETANPAGGMFNMKGLEDFLVETHTRSLPYLPSTLEETLNQFRQDTTIEDDITFLAVEVR